MTTCSNITCVQIITVFLPVNLKEDYEVEAEALCHWQQCTEIICRRKKRTLMSTGYSGTCKSIVLKLNAVTARTTHSECHSLYISNMSFVDSRQLWLVIVTYNMEEGWVGRKKWSKGNNLSDCRQTRHNQDRNQWAEGRRPGKLLGNNAPPKGLYSLFCSCLVLSRILPDHTSLFMPINSHSSIWFQCYRTPDPLWPKAPKYASLELPPAHGKTARYKLPSA